jgi:hypothetical protein
MLGFIPAMLSAIDPRPAKEQINANYAHGGGWRSFAGFVMLPNGNMQYPEDEPTVLLAETALRNETIRFYDGAWLAIIQPSGEFEVCRID